MKKTGLLVTFLAACFLLTAVSLNAHAEPKVMSDGQIFDAEFYANEYPDVKAALGNDEAKLYAHYLNYGKAEGRLPYKPTTVTTANAAVSAPATKDLMVGDIDGGAAKQQEIQAGYIALPQNVKNYFNKRKIRLFACTKEHIGAVSGWATIGYSYVVWNDNRDLVKADVYVCGSKNSFMPPRYTLYHELGHIVNCGNRYSDSWAGWTEMIPYSKEQAYNPSEAFSEAFAGYFERPEKLKKIAPNAYKYIENIIVNLK